MRTANLLVVSRTLLAALLGAALVGCGSHGSSSPDAATTAGTATSPTPAAGNAPAIVGRWSQLHSCTVLVHAFRAAGLGDLAALQAAAFGPDRPDSQMPSPAQLQAHARELTQGGDLCAGAHAPFRHDHFFTSSGLFGSISRGQQVDDGTYRVRGHTLFIGKAPFRFRITNGETLTLQPMITAAQRRRALAAPKAFSDAAWMVSVAYAGSTWHRVPCHGWC